MSDLRDILVGWPGIRHITATKKDVTETLLESDGTMLLNGELWDIKARHMAAGVYDVWLERHLKRVVQEGDNDERR